LFTLNLENRKKNKTEFKGKKISHEKKGNKDSIGTE